MLISSAENPFRCKSIFLSLHCHIWRWCNLSLSEINSLKTWHGIHVENLWPQYPFRFVLLIIPWLWIRLYCLMKGCMCLQDCWCHRFQLLTTLGPRLVSIIIIIIILTVSSKLSSSIPVRWWQAQGCFCLLLPMSIKYYWNISNACEELL